MTGMGGGSSSDAQIAASKPASFAAGETSIPGAPPIPTSARTAQEHSMKWYAVTFRGTAEMTVRVLAESPEDARQRAEDGNYVEVDDEDLHFVQGLPYTLKVRVDKP